MQTFIFQGLLLLVLVFFFGICLRKCCNLSGELWRSPISIPKFSDSFDSSHLSLEKILNKIPGDFNHQPSSLIARVFQMFVSIALSE